MFIMLIVIFMLIFCKDNANERNESLLSNCRMQLILCKDNKKDDTMRDRNVKMWMNFSFLDRICLIMRWIRKMKNI